MPQSLSNVIVHIVFSTKDRVPFIDKDISAKLNAYLAVVTRDHGCEAYRVGGMPDHVHLAVRLSRTITQADLLQEIKKESSKWIKKQGPDYSQFAWQKGYGCFSISQSQLDQLIAYICNQEKHHKTMTFQDEFRKLLEKYKVEFDERYVWD